MRPFDLQVNGYAGVDFCSPALDGSQLHMACQELADDGVDSILATLITDSVDSLVGKLANLVRLREQDSLIRKIVSGFHIEGPFLNASPGYIGAHPPEAVVPANLDDAKRLLDAASGLAKIVTLAPENDPDFATTRYLSGQGLTVSAGHCNPTLDQLQGAVDNGLKMVTHLGNGCPVELPRHDNVIQRILRFRDQLWICFIPDGAHIDFYALSNYLDLVGVDRAIMVTDAISAAKLGPGRHEISGMAVDVDAAGVARKPGQLNLAGSTLTMPKLRKHLEERLNLNETQIQALIDLNPRKALSHS